MRNDNAERYPFEERLEIQQSLLQNSHLVSAGEVPYPSRSGVDNFFIHQAIFIAISGRRRSLLKARLRASIFKSLYILNSCAGAGP